MEIWRTLSEVPDDLGPTVIVIGNFDGVHLGHRTVCARAEQIAEREGAALGDGGALPIVAVTFDPHPIAVLRPEHAPSPLTTIEQRAALLEQAGAAAVLVVAFDRDVANWSPEEFIERIVVRALRARAVVVGANFRFGHKAAGDVALLGEVGARSGFVAEGVPLDGGPQVWSSTYVRTCLATGDVEGAAEALGRPFTLRGEVVRGDRRGRELGYPTANVPTPEFAAAPADGVYAGRLRALDTGERWPAAISVGTNPTFAGERTRRVESYVLDRDDLDLYGREVEVEFVARLRGMTRFDGVEALLEQMADDVERTRAVLGLPAAD